MCGISVIVNSDLNNCHVSTIKGMISALDHRGPDDQRVLQLGDCCLGHTRLSIIDLKTGSQPMSTTDGRYCITFNGEIYNFRELKQELQRLGYGFQTSSDTEVILSAYTDWGAACLDRFRGMFSFAIWDTHERKLFAARDLFGEKPLYYASGKGDSFLIASEIKALIASGLWALTPESSRQKD